MWSGPICLLLMSALCMVQSMPTETTQTTRSIGSTTKKHVNQVVENATTTMDMILDIRTPPKVKQQVQNKMKIKSEVEKSHAGVAIPVDEDSLEMEESTKKLNFYKIEKPTTNSGLSTWILLSGQASVTTKPPSTRKPIIKPVEEIIQPNLSVIVNDKPPRIVKPVFKQRPTTTQKTTTTQKSTTSQKPTETTTKTSTTVKYTTKLTKVKASVLNHSIKKLNSTVEGSTKKSTGASSITTMKPISSTRFSVRKNVTTVENSTLSTVNASTLPLEGKNDEVDLPTETKDDKKKKTKRKKNKTRRRKPEKKDNNSTSVLVDQLFKNKPISTQLYNYLAREIMPTVGVGLVGLMVTAGLASYFLYPFGIARRSSEIDRKDKEGSYYYNDDYSGGMPEEEAIGKVIAGMPGNSLFENSYKSPTSRNVFFNTKYRLSDRRAPIQKNSYGGMVQGTVESVPLTSVTQENAPLYDKPSYTLNNYQPSSYSNDYDSRYSPSNDQNFVVGNIPKEIVTEVTPAAVPEHGPRNLDFDPNYYAEHPVFLVDNHPYHGKKDTNLDIVPEQRPRSLRKRRDIPSDTENEIASSLDKEEITTNNQDDLNETTIVPTLSSSNITEKSETTTPEIQTTTGLPEKINSFIDMMKELIHLKAKIGLQMIQNAANSISKYISRVQSRLNQHYRESSKNKQ